jgi:hypothetical protein
VKALYFILFAVICTTPGCSRFTTSGRRERAYANYVHKSRIDHARRQTRIRKEKARIPSPDAESSEQREAIRMQDGPQAAARDPDNQ